ncbi:Putative LOC100645596 [Caligus rogercresseyi]|uniref:LOC100645596 n=1 Tax=Caligus rogercresseyi TaxID=217165 RepID=A0A7T8KBU0_CALRO|nr:Putative LOC100645596 [Caligus rogercresseyi]
MIKTEEADWKSSETFDKKYKPEKSEEDPYGWVVPKKKKIFLASQKNEILSDKFKSGRPHPFENLLRLSKNRQSLDDDDDRSEEAIKDEDYEEDNKSSQNEILGDEKVIPKKSPIQTPVLIMKKMKKKPFTSSL